MIETSNGNSSAFESQIFIDPAEYIFSPVGILLGTSWMIFLVWLAATIHDTSSKTFISPTKSKKKKGEHSCDLRHILMALKNDFRQKAWRATLDWLRSLPHRGWVFCIAAFIVPAYRPEWGKYAAWKEMVIENNTPETIHMKKVLSYKQEMYLMTKDPHPVPHNHQQCQKVKFNVSGRIFETQLRTLNRFPRTLLGNPQLLERFMDPDLGMYFFDRMPASFEAILYYFQSGGYLRCPENVQLDIFYSDCEFYGVDEKAIQKFKVEEGISEEEQTLQDIMPKNLLQRKIYLLFDYPESSFQARIVATFSVFVVIVSVVTFILETQPEFRTNTPSPSGAHSSLRQFEASDPFFFTEIVSSVWFTIEFFVRLFVAPRRWEFLKNLQNAIDLISVVPFYVGLTFPALTRDSGQPTSSLGILRVVRLVRVFRVFKLSRHSRGLRILGLTLKSSVSELSLLIFFLFLAVVLFASCLYFAEQGVEGSDFESIPHGFWFTVITMTTVGYGDDFPKSALGKIVGSFCAITGVLTIALPVPVIVSNFNYYYHQSVESEDFEVEKLNHVEICPYRSGKEQVLEPKESAKTTN